MPFDTTAAIDPFNLVTAVKSVHPTTAQAPRCPEPALPAMQPEAGFVELYNALNGAYQQVLTGKWQERHGLGRPFKEQPIITISDMLQSNLGLAYQVMNKTQEAQRMEPAAAIKELQGAIIYAAAIITRLKEEA